MLAGDPVEAVLLALEAAEKVFGVDTNARGYKVPRGCGVIQGDGISIEVLDQILQAVMAKGYSAQVLSLCHVICALHPSLTCSMCSHATCAELVRVSSSVMQHPA